MVCPVCVCVSTRVFEQGVTRGLPRVCVCVSTRVLEQGVTRGLPRVCVCMSTLTRVSRVDLWLRRCPRVCVHSCASRLSSLRAWGPHTVWL